jgi:hypothetical protein
MRLRLDIIPRVVEYCGDCIVIERIAVTGYRTSVFARFMCA